LADRLGHVDAEEDDMNPSSLTQPLIPMNTGMKKPTAGNIGQPLLTRREKLTRYGYFTEDNVLSPDHLARLRPAMDRLLRDGPVDYRLPHQDQYPNFIDFDDAFSEIIDLPAIHAILEDTVGPDVQLRGNEVCVSKPTGRAGNWHRDKMSIGRHSPTIVLKIALYIHDVAIDGGPTGVIPESHFDIYKGEQFYPYKIDYLAKAGSLLAFGASTLHRAGLHTDNWPPRPAMFMTFVPWWVKQASYFSGNRCQRLIESASPMRRQLLGIEMRPGIGMDHYSSQ
jgi:hypothetical protein